MQNKIHYPRGAQAALCGHREENEPRSIKLQQDDFFACSRGARCHVCKKILIRSGFALAEYIKKHGGEI